MSPARVAPPLVAAAHEAPLRWRRALGVGLAAAAAVIVLAVLVHPAPRPQAARASASCPMPIVNGTEESAARWAFCERLRQAVLSDTFLLAAVRRASGESGSMAGDWPPPAVLRQWLDVEIKPLSADNRVEISITCRAEDPGRACRLASALAEEAIAWAAAERAQAELAARHAAQAAVEQARKRYAEAQARLESFLDSHFAEHRNLAAAAAESKAQVQSSLSPPAPARSGAGPAIQRPKAALESNPPGVEQADSRGNSPPHTGGDAPAPQNPQWVRLNGELDQLRSELAIMLIERTTAHPAVQDLQRRIRELEVHLQSIPRLLSAPETRENNSGGTESGRKVANSGRPQPASVSHAEDAPSDGAAAAEAPRHAQAVEAYRTRKDAWLAAAAELDHAERQERQQWVRQAGRNSSVTDSAVLRLPEQATAPRFAWKWSYLAALALAAGLTAAFGTLLISAGLDIDVPLASAASARRCLPTPVIGVVRIASEQPVVPAGNPLGRRVGLMAAGSLVLAGCIALVAAAL